MESNAILQTAVAWHRIFEDRPADAHLCCPKIDEEDVANYDEPDVPDEGGVSADEKKRRIKEYESRFQNVYDLSILMGLGREVAGEWLDNWTQTVEACLTRCDSCVRNWHRNREPYLNGLHLAPEMIDYMRKMLGEFDKGRIDKGLQRARAILEEHGPMATAKLVEHDMSAVLALFEALCSIEYLCRPENREDFDYVFEKTQQKRPLRMQGGLIPTMTYFLFDDFASPYRQKFAESAWEKRPPESLTDQEWDWAICPHLTTAILKVSLSRGMPSADKICKFWRGFSFILRSLSEKQIINSLRAMEVSPSVYFLALEHLATDSDEALAMVLKGLRALMEKSPSAFWAAFHQVTPSQLVEEIFKSPAFRRFLNKSLMSDMMVTEGDNQVPALAAWMRALIRSLPSIQRSDVCESLLRHLFDTFRRDPNADRAAQATCTLAGLVTLSESLDGYLHQEVPFDTGTALIMVNQLLNRVVQYGDVIITAAGLKPGDTFNVGISQTAMAIIHSALALDARATEIEWKALIEEIPVQDAVNRDSGALWESFLEMLWYGQLGHVELAKAMLMATLRLRNIERFIPKRKEQLKREQQKFNLRYQQQTAAIGKMLGRLSDFKQDDLNKFCSERQSPTIHPIVSSLIHGEDAIREAGFELLKATTGESLPSDAVGKMLEDYFSPFLDAISEAVNKVTAGGGASSPWSHMLPILKCSEFVLNGLCDPSVGQLRRKSLTTEEHTSVKRWWECVWQAVDHSFRMMRTWHEKVDKKIMEDFCRDVMELAKKLFAQDGVMASALSQHSSDDAAQTNGDDTAKAMRSVLEPPRKYSFSLADMLQLRDKYLIMGIIEVFKKLVARLKQNNMDLPQKTLAHLGNMLKRRKLPGGRLDYVQKTNLTDEQRIELLKALGEDAAIDEQFMGTKPGEKEAKEKERAMRQSKIDFSKGGLNLSGLAKGHMADITPNFEKRGSALLARLKEEGDLKPKQLTKLDHKAMLANQMSIKEARARDKAEKIKRDAEAIAKAKALRAPPKTVPGEGSGLQGIAGVRGKDHTPVVKDEIMVGSSSEEEEDSDDERIRLKAKAGNKNLNEAECRRLLMLAEKRGPVKKVKLQRSAKDMRARLIPPMDVLHQAILEWDIFHEGNDPPNGYRYETVSNSYTNPHSYKQTFFPLLINEAWRSFVTAKDEATSKPLGIKVLSRMSVDTFMEVTASVPTQVSKDRGLSEGDIVLVSKGEDPLNQPTELHCLSRIWKTTYKKDTVEVVFRLSSRGNHILQSLLPGSQFHVVKITNMTTIEREYAALESLQYYDLMDEVLKAQPSPMLTFGDEAVNGVMENYQLNVGQARAILNAKENDGFTLVQGPPGTGKTKTIVAMVGSLLTGLLKSSNGAVPLARPVIGPSHGQAPPAKKLLVCAPSNAAVDELVLRLKAGVKTMHGTSHKINVLRLGRTDAINAGVKDVTLDELVKARMEAEINNSGPSDREKLHQEAGVLKEKIGELRPQLEAARASDNRTFTMKLQREFDELKRRQAHIGAKIDQNKSNGNTFARETEIKRRQIQQDILDKAQVLCATLSGSGHEMFKNLNVEFETVIIDEAAQCVELSALIPLKYGCSKCILVGDPKQLPPTVLSQSAARYGYDQSLFVRMQKNHSKDVHLLDMQYRMHPEISRFPSKEFYEGLLQDGADMGKLRMQPWHQSALLGPYRFFDVKGSQSRGPKNQSLVNEEELKVAMQLYRRFRSDYSGVDSKGKIGIITPYKAQLFRLRQRFAEKYGDGITEEIEFNTTDAFQGRECEIIIFSCVRASPTGGIGFMTDIRRMNVGLTRAKSSLWILGDSRALVQGEFWGKLIEDAKQRDRYTSGNVMALLSQPGQKVPLASLTAPPSGPTQTLGAIRNTDVAMTDAPEITLQKASVSNAPTQQQGPATTRPYVHEETTAPPTLPYRGTGIGGLNERGEVTSMLPRGGGAPMIQSTAGSAGKKRPRDNNDDGRSAPKKTHHPGSDRGPARAPTGYHKHNKHKQPKPPTDPSAMQVLGLAPPERPPAEQAQTPQPHNRPPSAPRLSAGPNAPKGSVMLPKRPNSDPFIRRKPGKR
ncbi:SEN1 N terminal-domain-containing protein [Chaetomidium leptoderma]|uniref:SEN1 N terminal-domain-containing protein n=1 Tax=Chaetomidium leptoderma TaxID=669021 RepID=A0AAN6ZY35_9PEZI|nr:SEN1 N terminal-domain-containing protein [Chaetomidium leptoderma]